MYEAVTKGLTVHHGDFNEGLSYYPDDSFDYVILSQTLQEAHDTVAVLDRSAPGGTLSWWPASPTSRTGRRGCSCSSRGGRRSLERCRTSGTTRPNVHSLSIKDFRVFAREQGIRIVRHFYLTQVGPRAVLAEPAGRVRCVRPGEGRRAPPRWAPVR